MIYATYFQFQQCFLWGLWFLPLQIKRQLQFPDKHRYMCPTQTALPDGMFMHRGTVFGSITEDLKRRQYLKKAVAYNS